MSRGSDATLRKPVDALKLALQACAPVAMVIVALVMFASPIHAQSASSLSKRGAAAELRHDYDAAYEDYRQATLKKPKDLRYKTHMERVRPEAAFQHIDQGRLLRQNGNYGGAIEQFMRALEIDPSSETAHQEIRFTQQQQPPATPTGPAAKAEDEEISHQHEMLESINDLAGPVELKPVSNDPITLHMVEDTKVIYQAIGKLAGLNVLFDPDYTSRRIPIDLTNVSLSDALRIVGTISDTFYKPVTGNTIFVAQNTRTKRTSLEDLGVQTFYLSNSSQPNDGNEILTGLRLLLDPSAKLYLVPSQNAIVIRATTDQLLLAQKLINDFDRARAEVVMDVAVLEVNRDKIRNLGITLPTSIGLTPQLPTTSTTGTSTTPTATTATNLTLNNLAHLNASDFAVSVSGGTLNALLSDIDTRVLQNPRIRATDGQRATLKIGEKIPIATGSYSAGVATGVANLGVQTQFTFVDVGVNIDITPTVHLDRDISLKMHIEVSQQNGSQTISGVTEPIIGQRILEQVIQLKEGEPSILAGILTKQDNHNVAGTPGLGEIPFFKFFFSTQSREVQDDEIVFLVIPHIVRESVITRLNTQMIDTGTSNSIELRRAPSEPGESNLNTPALRRNPTPPYANTSAANAANAALQSMHEEGQPGSAASAAGAANAAVGAGNRVVPGAPISLSVVPSSTSQAVGSTFQVAVNLANGANVYAVPMQVQYNPHVLQLVNVDAGNFLSQDGKPVALVHRDDPATGLVSVSTTRAPATDGVSGQGNIAMFTFKAIAPGDVNVSLVKVGAKDSQQNNLAAVGSQAVVHVK